jgi:SAM-dependent methyltransferase
MKRLKDTRETVLKSSRAYYTHRAYYWDLTSDRHRKLSAMSQLELDFIEHVFTVDAARPVKQVLDVACGSGRHIFELAKRGLDCTGWDFTPERIQVAKERAKRKGISVKLQQGGATQLNYEDEFDAVLALYLLFLLPNDDDVLKCLKMTHRALRTGGILVCNIGNPFCLSKKWFSPKGIADGLFVNEDKVVGIEDTEIVRLREYDPIRGVAWWQETSIIKAPDGTHIFKDKERIRLLTYWDLTRYLQEAGFKDIKCYPDWKTKPPKKPKAEWLVFVARKD